MAVTFAVFSRKYPEFANRLQAFEDFYSDAIAEVSKYQFGNLLDAATEFLIAHKIAIAGNGTTSGGTLQEIEIDDEGYKVKFQDSADDYSSTKYGREYHRLLKIATGNDSESWNPTKGAIRVDARTDKHPQKW
jgi:hypothetical protein